MIFIKKYIYIFFLEKMSNSTIYYKNGYIPKITRAIDVHSDLDLGEVFAKHAAERFIGNPKTYLGNTKVINFGIIQAEIEHANATNRISNEIHDGEMKKLQRKAEAIKILDFKTMKMSISCRFLKEHYSGRKGKGKNLFWMMKRNYLCKNL